MKKYHYIYLVLIAFTTFSCGDEDAGDCIQPAGNIITKEVSVPSFSKIIANQEIILILKQGNKQSVHIETGENLINDIKIDVTDQQLVLTNNNSCNLFRDYGVTKIHVTTPNLTEIRCNTNRYIKSEGVLEFPNITIFSENYNNDSYLNNGDVLLNLKSEKISVVANGISKFVLEGSCNFLSIYFAANDTRFEGEKLISNHAKIIHKSSNDIIINPVLSLKAEIFSVGNIIAKNKPNAVLLEEHYKGRLIFD